MTLTNGNNNIYVGNQGADDENQIIRISTAEPSTGRALDVDVVEQRVHRDLLPIPEQFLTLF